MFSWCRGGLRQPWPDLDLAERAITGRGLVHTLQGSGVGERWPRVRAGVASSAYHAVLLGMVFY
jgi:hypothetical protein